MVYLVFNTSRTVPPYAREIMDWGYSFCCQSDKSESLGSLYYFRDSTSTWDTYVNSDHNASAYDNNQLKDYIVEEHRNLSSNGGIFDDVCRITFDNSSNSKPGTVTQWLLMVGKVAGSSNTGHTKVTIKTTSDNYTMYYPRFNGSGTAESPLQIASGADLKAFATIINSGVIGTAKLYAVLTNDIDYTKYTDASAMIGTKLTPYKGVFDGQGYTVTLALNNTTEEYTGLFSHADSASIRNLEVTGSMTGLRMLGGVVGNATGITTLENVISSVSITGSSSTTGIGGLISAVGDDKAAWTHTIRNCAFTGSVEGDFSKMTYNGLSYVRELSTLNITNCYTIDSPVEMLAYEMRVQTIALSKGWNWISLFVDPFADKGLNDLFSNQKELTVNDIFRTPFGSDFATYQSDGTWDETMDELLFEKESVYQIYAHNESSVEVSGSLYDNPSVTLDFTQSEWAQMAYLSDKPMPIRQALSDFVAGSESAPAGTVVKGYNSFAVANADGTWAGSLEYLRPGEGYFVRRNGLRDNVTIHYANGTSSSSTKSVLMPSVSSDVSNPDMMPLIAAFADGDLQQGDRLLALVGNEVIAVAEATEGVFFVSLHAKQGEPIVFAKERNGEVVAVTTKGFNFDAQGVAGSMEHPYLIDFTEDDSDAPIYDIQGIKYDRIEKGAPRVFIQGSKKTINY